MAIVTFASLTVGTSSESWDEKILASFTPDGDSSRTQTVETGGLVNSSVMALGVTMQFNTEVVAEFTEIDAITPNDKLGTVKILAGDPLGPFSRTFSGDGGRYTLTGTLVNPPVVTPPEIDTPDVPDPTDIVGPLHVLVDNPIEVLGLVGGLNNISSAIGNVTTAQNATTTAITAVSTNVGTAATALAAVSTALAVGNGHLAAINGSLAPLAQIKSELTTANTHLTTIAASLGQLAQIKAELTTLNTKIDVTNTQLSSVITKLGEISGKLPL